MQAPPDARILQRFGLEGVAVPLAGGEGRSFRVGNAVLKYIDDAYKDEALWLADVLSHLKQVGFRTSRPIRSQHGDWLVDSWTASDFLEGKSARPSNVSEIIDAVRSFHQSMASIEKPVFLDRDNDSYARADNAAWGECPRRIAPEVDTMVRTLYDLRRPIDALVNQVIHGDLNPDNILIKPGLMPGIIDLTPYWRPNDFALAIYAYWIGPWRGDATVLSAFSQVDHFGQLLVRAALRMLLIMSESGQIRDLRKYARATETVIRFLQQKP